MIVVEIGINKFIVHKIEQAEAMLKIMSEAEEIEYCFESREVRYYKTGSQIETTVSMLRSDQIISKEEHEKILQKNRDKASETKADA